MADLGLQVYNHPCASDRGTAQEDDSGTSLGSYSGHSGSNTSSCGVSKGNYDLSMKKAEGVAAGDLGSKGLYGPRGPLLQWGGKHAAAFLA